MRQHLFVQHQQRARVHLERQVNEPQLLGWVALDQAQEDLLTQPRVVAAIVRQLLLHLKRYRLQHTIGAVHRLTLGRQLKVFGQLGQTVAHLDTAQCACHGQGVEDEAGLCPVAPGEYGHVELCVVRQHRRG